MYSMCIVVCVAIIGASLSKPHIDHDNIPRTRNIYYLSIYVCIIYPGFVTPWFPRSMYTLYLILRVFRYIDMLTCVIYN